MSSIQHEREICPILKLLIRKPVGKFQLEILGVVECIALR